VPSDDIATDIADGVSKAGFSAAKGKSYGTPSIGQHSFGSAVTSTGEEESQEGQNVCVVLELVTDHIQHLTPDNPDYLTTVSNLLNGIANELVANNSSDEFVTRSLQKFHGVFREHQPKYLLEDVHDFDMLLQPAMFLKTLLDSERSLCSRWQVDVSLGEPVG
jgi:hypothetical protein